MTDPLIVSDPKIMMGKPVVAGTRITIELVLGTLDTGETIEQLLESHRRPSREAVLTALTFASEILGTQVVLFGHDGRTGITPP